MPVFDQTKLIAGGKIVEGYGKFVTTGTTVSVNTKGLKLCIAVMMPCVQPGTDEVFWFSTTAGGNSAGQWIVNTDGTIVLNRAAASPTSALGFHYILRGM